ncbi:MAG: glycoside hydrolase family 3 C-terminal domain-containing protein [Acidobacteriota bacterium]
MKMVGGLALAMVAMSGSVAVAQARPWMNPKLTAEQRAEMVVKEMTLDEKIGMLHGEGMPGWNKMPEHIIALQGLSNGGAGFVLGVKRLGIPMIQMSDAAYGVRSSAENGRYSTALPSDLGAAASWDVQAACAYGALIGSELRAQGYNMTLGGGTNLAREPRNGRTFEYLGEDPVLAGTMDGNRIKCEGAQHVISDMKHYAVNDQESGRQEVDSLIGERALRESDLLAFQLAYEIGSPKAVMCSYNGVNGVYACENPMLLTDVLKKEWGFKGFVVSDWEGTHSTAKASHAGLDQEQPLDLFYGAKLKEAVEKGEVSQAELDEHVKRVLWAEFASGMIDDPVKKSEVDPQKGFDTSRRIEEQSAVLLKNGSGLLPLSREVKSVAVIGMHADTGMISGGGSAQVDAPGEASGAPWQSKVWFPTSPLEALRAKAPGARMGFASGANIAEAVALAKQSDVAVVFAWQWESEDMDLPSLSLPEGQDKLIAAVTDANPRTVVVLETGSAVTMPWLDRTGAVLEAWYGGVKGADAVANLLFGDVNPSGKLPLTFPVSESDLPRATVAKPPQPVVNGVLSFKVDYSEGAEVGYKWYETEKKPVLFPFGFGLSYTTFAYSGLKVAADGSEATFTLANTGKRKGAEVAEVYAMLPAKSGESWKRLVGWQKVELEAGESRVVKVKLNGLAMAVWDVAGKKFVRPVGKFELMAGGSSAELPLKVDVSLE